MPANYWNLNTAFVARELAPAGLRSGPRTSHNSECQVKRGLRLLRSRAGASSLATENLSARTCSALQRSAAMASTDSRISAGPL